MRKITHGHGLTQLSPKFLGGNTLTASEPNGEGVQVGGGECESDKWEESHVTECSLLPPSPPEERAPAGKKEAGQLCIPSTHAF